MKDLEYKVKVSSRAITQEFECLVCDENFYTLERAKAHVLDTGHNVWGGGETGYTITRTLNKSKEMKVSKKVPFKIEEVLFIPDNMEPGVFYYTEQYKTGSHLCACGCGQEWHVPIKQGQWEIENTEPLTINPSFQHRFGCKSHYIFKDGFALIF